jgi:hypothetical protein
MKKYSINKLGKLHISEEGDNKHRNPIKINGSFLMHCYKFEYANHYPDGWKVLTIYIMN